MVKTSILTIAKKNMVRATTTTIRSTIVGANVTAIKASTSSIVQGNYNNRCNYDQRFVQSESNGSVVMIFLQGKKVCSEDNAREFNTEGVLEPRHQIHGVYSWK